MQPKRCFRPVGSWIAFPRRLIFIIRTRGSPLRSRPNPLLAGTSLVVAAVGVLLPYTAIGRWFGFVSEAGGHHQRDESDRDDHPRVVQARPHGASLPDRGIYSYRMSASVEPVESPCVCATLRMATRAVARVYDQALEPHGLRTTEYSILSRLEVEGPAPVGQLAARLAMDRTTLAREAAPLVSAGLVTEEPGEDRAGASSPSRRPDWPGSRRRAPRGARRSDSSATSSATPESRDC